MQILKKILARIRKNKVNPYEPDVELNLAPLVKRLFKKKRPPRTPPKM